MRGGRGTMGALGTSLCAAAALLMIALHTIPLEGQGGSRTVLDYYYLLPDYLFYCESPVQATRGLRQRSIVRSNIRNGYMEAKSEGYPMYLALFNNRKTGLEIVAVSISCGQGCMCNRFDLLRRQGDAWREVTASIMPTAQEMNSAVPNRSGGSFSYELPEFGTAIRVLDYDTEEHLMDLQWDGARFVIRRRNL